MATLEQHTARWLDLPWVACMWNSIAGRDLLPAVQKRIIMPMLERGVDPGRHRMELSIYRDSVSTFLNVKVPYPHGSAVSGKQPRQWILRPSHATDCDSPEIADLNEFISFLATHYVRQDRILAHMGEAGRFRRRDPAWSYDVHPVLAAHLRGHDVSPDEFLDDIVGAGPFRSVTQCVSRSTDMDAVICHLPERLGYLDGEIVHGNMSLGKIDLSRQVTFNGTRDTIVLRQCALPETVLAGMVGQHATKVVDHHALDIPGLDVIGTRRRGANIEFRVRSTPVPLDEGRPEGFLAPGDPIPCLFN